MADSGHGAATTDLDTLKQLATQHWRAGQLSQAEAALDRVLALDPSDAHAWSGRAMCLAALGKRDEAIEAFSRAAALEPGSAALQYNLGRAFAESQRWVEATACYQRALALAPRSAEILGALAEASRDTTERLDALDRLSQLRPLQPQEQFSLARALFELERFEDADQAIDRVLQAEPLQLGAQLLKAQIQALIGNHDEAVSVLHLVLKRNPRYAPAYWFLTQSKKFTQQDQAQVETMARMAESAHGEDRAVLHLALGNASNDLGLYEQAMQAYDEANRIYKELRGRGFDRRAFSQDVDLILRAFPKNLLAGRADFGIDNELPIFIVGMPRSGTTLVESIVSAHPEVAAGGEQRFWQNEAPRAVSFGTGRLDPETAHGVGEAYLALLGGLGRGAARVTDKNPFNFLHAGLISLILPRARFIHCVRHPVDTCLSIYQTRFQDPPAFAFDQGDIVFAYRQYARLVAHWKSGRPPETWMEVHYEHLVDDQEGMSRHLIEFCGLEWDDACLRPERNDRVVTTMSHWQVRQPVYRTSIERWRNYEPWLGGFEELLRNPPDLG
jgi:tetratricopeptide (TPR) repeat protein